MRKPAEILRDRLILVQCRQGKEEGFEGLVSAYERPLFYYVRRLLDREEDCWDALQETWLLPSPVPRAVDTGGPSWYAPGYGRGHAPRYHHRHPADRGAGEGAP